MPNAILLPQKEGVCNYHLLITKSLTCIVNASSIPITGRFRRLGQCFLDWATAVVGEGDACQLSVSFTYHSSGPINETLAQSTEFDGTVV